MKLFSHPFAPYSRFIGYIEDIGESSLVFEGTHPQSIEKVAFCGKIHERYSIILCRMWGEVSWTTAEQPYPLPRA